MNVRIFIVTIITVFALIGCQSTKVTDDTIIPAQSLYNSGVNELENGNYKTASEQFEKIFFQHPGSETTSYAELMQAYSLYLAGEYSEVVDILEIFIKLHPRHKDIAYAYYLKALAQYAQISNVRLDQSQTKNALSDMQEVRKRFPQSQYALDVESKINLVNDHLAGKEMFIGRYYLNKNNPIAAIKRFQHVIDQYDTTSHSPEALYRLVECNMMLGLDLEAKKYAAVLKYNYPNSKWLAYSYNLLK